ncbi:MAG: DNA repair protein RecO [Bacillota bacterium]|nr:DNA repair protein RecO [Bacillota bacterium]
MRATQVSGLVLRTRKYGEADHLLSILTLELGKVTAIAKGARKTTGSMRGKTQPFVFGTYMLYKGKNMYTVTQAEIKHSFGKIGEDVAKYAYANYICELMDSLLEEGEPVPGLFKILLSTINSIEKETSPLIAPWFQLQLLQELGYGPQFQDCVACNKKIKAGAVIFALDTGGIVCEDCTNQKPNLSGGARGALSQLLQMRIEKVWRLKLSAPIMAEIDELAKSLINMHLVRPLKSDSFLQCIKQD